MLKIRGRTNLCKNNKKINIFERINKFKRSSVRKLSITETNG